MGHSIRGIITKTSNLQASDLPGEFPTAVGLPQGFSIVPFFDDYLDQVRVFESQVNEVHDGFTYLDSRLEAHLKEISKEFPLAYIETDYFGGAGSQGAAVFRAGSIDFGPSSGEIGPINQALILIGVSRLSAHDEFDALLLGKYRNMEKLQDTE